jgi:autotransporter-associated beta strand protein
VVATVTAGTTYSLAIKAPVSASVVDIQNGVTATASAAGSLSAGTLQLEGVLDLTGSQATTAGTLRLAGGTLNIASGGTLNVSGGVGDSSGVLSGSGVFNKVGSGTLTLAGAYSGFTGTTNISGGSLILAGSGLVGGAVEIGGTAALYLGSLANGTLSGLLSGSGASN